MNCTSPYAHTSNHVFIMTNVVINPILFGIGIIGNILILIILNRSFLRTTSAIYVYLTGLAACDLLILMLAIPRILRDTAVVPLEIGYSKEMAQYVTYEYGFINILKHAAIWIIVFVSLVRYVTLTSPLKKRRLTTISASRIIVFVIVLFCLVLDFPRFFEMQVVEKKHHCLEKKVLWDWDFTPFASNALYLKVYPWVIVTAGFALPFFLMGLIGVLFAVRIRLGHILRNYVNVTSQADGNEVQVNVLLVAIIVSFLVLELPTAILNILFAVRRERVKHTSEYNEFTLLANCLSFLHSSINFILYTAINGDFRKTFRRTFCCVCITGDEYYEPMTCMDILTCACCNRVQKETISSRASSASSRGSKVPPPNDSSSEVSNQPRPPTTQYVGPNVSKDGWI